MFISSSKFLNGKHEFWFYGLCSAVGISISFLTVNQLNGYQFNFGKNLIGLFIHPTISLFYAVCTGYRYRFSKSLLGKTLLLYAFQIIPFVPLFFQVFQPTPEDDFSRYYLYARNMIENHTLWGGDKLFFADTGYSYATQPGYRYFIAFELLVFGGLYRIVQFINIILFIIASFYLLNAIKQITNRTSLQLHIFSIIILFTPYTVKNILMGISEWFAALVLMIGVYMYVVKKRPAITLFILALVPFFRQNLLVAILLLALWIVIHHRKKPWIIFAFIFPILLPVYHNLYYAGEWRFFVKLFATPFVNKLEPAGFNFKVALWNLLRLFGFERLDGHTRFDALAILFLPLSVILYYRLLKKFILFRLGLMYCLITLSAILPGLLLGKDYYPRFEFVSVIMVISIYCFLSENLSQHLVRYKTINNS